MSDAAVAFLERLLDGADWYHSAIELDDELDGIKLKAEAERIVNDAQIGLHPADFPE